jgi:hypothetical protein
VEPSTDCYCRRPESGPRRFFIRFARGYFDQDATRTPEQEKWTSRICFGPAQKSLTKRQRNLTVPNEELHGVMGLMKFPNLSFFRAKRNCETPERHSTSDQSQQVLISKRVLLIPLRSPGEPAPNRDVPSRGKFNMTLQQILADPSISSWLKAAIKMAYEQEPLDALRDAHRLLKMLGERYTQVVNRDLLP